MKLVKKFRIIGYNKVKKLYFFTVPRLVRLIAGKVNQKLILLDSPSYKDNIKVLAEYISKNKPDYRIICYIEKDAVVKKYKRIRFVKRAYSAGSKQAYSISAYYYALKAKYVFYTHSFKWVGEKNNGQVIINLWHGSGYKGGEAATIEHSFDFMMVPGEIFIKSKAEFFNCDPSKILPFGYPRYDLYDKKRPSAFKKVFQKININIKTDKILLWLPTFIPDEYLLNYENPLPYIYSGLPLIENLGQMMELDQFCKQNNIKLIVKKHNLRYSKTPLDNYLGKLENVLILSDDEFKELGIELYELLPLTSGLISDFSSVAVDYMLLDRPLAYVVKDIEDYRNTRGFVFNDPLEYMPGYHVYNVDEIKSFIADVAQGNDKYKNLREDKISLMHNKTENYSKRILEFLKI